MVTPTLARCLNSVIPTPHTYLLCEAMAVLYAKARSWLWQTMEYPHTSSLAQVLAWFSLSMVLVSTFTFIVSTADILQTVQGSLVFSTSPFVHLSQSSHI